MEDLILELVDGLDVVDHLPYEVRGVIVETEIIAGNDREKLSPDCGSCCKILSAGPLVVSEEHGAVLDGNLDALLFCELDDRGPNLLELLDVLFYGLILHSADEGRYHIYAEKRGHIDDLH